jgi:predicted RNA-binding Zn-ribbon protein involved in translation (DUF1610 family)
MSSDAGGRPPVSVRPVNCPSCGAVVEVRTFGHAVTIVCPSCGSVLDAQDAGVRILQQFKKAVRFDPLIPLGTRGKVLGIDYEVVGFQVREILVDGTPYRWREYLLFNPYQRFRYLTEFDGHWNVVSTLRSLPAGAPGPVSEQPRWYDRQRFRHFQTATAKTIFVLGEFPWQVRVGETATVVDLVAPPRMLSAEITEDKEVTWSLGEYVPGAAIWSALALPGAPPPAKGIFADQPSPFTGVVGRMWRRAALLALAATVVWLAHLATAREKRSFSQEFAFDPRSAQDTSFVTPVFELDGRPSAILVETAATLDNQWIFVGYALVNDETGQTFEFGREVSYYHGVEDGEAWTEGSGSDAVALPQIPPGRYFLRIEPEGEQGSMPVRYRVTVVRDVATSMWFIAALVLLILPPIGASFKSAAFERRRWQESDHASSSSDGDDDDDD